MMSAKRGFKALVVAALGSLLVAGSVSAQTISIGVSTAGGPIENVASGSMFAGVGMLPRGGYTITSQGVSLGQGGLSGTNIDVTTTSNPSSPLVVYITSQGNSIPSPSILFTSAFSAITLSSNFTVNEATYYDPANGLFTTNTTGAFLLSSVSFISSPGGAVPSGPLTGISFQSGDASFSVTQVFTITATGAGNTNTGITLTALAVPVPVAGAGVGGLLILAGGWLVGRKKASKLPA